MPTAMFHSLYESPDHMSIISLFGDNKAYFYHQRVLEWFIKAWLLQQQNHWQMKCWHWAWLQYSLLVGKPWSWYSCGCSLTHKTLLNIVLDKTNLIVPTALHGSWFSGASHVARYDLDLGHFKVRWMLKILCHVPPAGSKGRRTPSSWYLSQSSKNRDQISQCYHHCRHF